MTNGQVDSLVGLTEIGDSYEENAAEKKGFMTTWNGTIVPDADGAVTLKIGAGAASDEAGNASLASATTTLTATARPTVKLTADAGPVKGPFTVIATFSAPVALADAGPSLLYSNLKTDLTYTLRPLNGQPLQASYSVTVSPAASGEVWILIPADAATDAGGRKSVKSNRLVVLADLDAPTVVSMTGPSETPTGPFDVDVEFNEPVTEVLPGSFDVTNGAAKSVSAQNADEGGYATSWTVSVRPTFSATTTVTLKANGARDRAGNPNAATSTVAVGAVAQDLTATITLSDTTLPLAVPYPPDVPAGTRSVKGPFDVTITFSEPVKGLTKADVSFPHISGKSRATSTAVTPVNPQDGYAAEWTVAVEPSSDLSGLFRWGLVDVSLNANVAQDVDGVSNAAAGTLRVKYNPNAPTIKAWLRTEVKEWPLSLDSVLTREEIREYLGVLRDGFQLRVELADRMIIRPLDEFVTITNGRAVSMEKKYEKSETHVIVDVRPEVSGDIIITIGKPGSVCNDALVCNTASQKATFTIDLPPVVRLSGPAGPVKEEFTVEIDFVENVTGFGRDDVNVTNGTLTGFTSQGAGTSTTWSAKVTPAASGTTTVAVAAGAATSTVDTETNLATTFSVQADLDRPTVDVGGSSTSTVSEVFDVAITFNEPVSGLEAGELEVTNGTVVSLNASNPDDDGRAAAWNAKIAPLTNGAVTIAVPKGAAEDVVGWTNTASNVYSRTAAGVERPTVEMVPVLDPTLLAVRNTLYEIDITFSKPVIGLDKSDLKVRNGTVNGLREANKKTGYTTEWKATFTPTAEGEVTISLGANAARDESGLGNLPAQDITLRANFGAPTLTITDMPGYWLPNRDPFTISFDFSEPVRVDEESLSDFVCIRNGTVSNLVKGDLTPEGFYGKATVTVTPNPDAVHVFGWVGEEGKWWDDAGNLGGLGPQVHFQVDVTPPSVTISKEGESDPVTGAFNLKIEFSEPVSPKDQTKVTVANGAFTLARHPSDDEDNLLYLAQVTPKRDGDVVFTLGKGAFVDRVGKTHETARFTEEADLSPTAVLSTDKVQVSGDFDITVEFSEPVTGFDKADLAVTNGVAKSVATTSSALAYTAVVTPTVSQRQSDVTVQLPAGSVTDTGGNANLASNTLTVSAVILGPIPTITGPDGPEDGAFEVQVRFDKGVSGFTGIVVGNATSTQSKAPVGSPLSHTYYYTITPAATGWVTVDVPEGAGTSNSGHKSSRARQYRVWADPNPPTVTLRVASEVQVGQTSFDIFIEFSEKVTGLDLATSSADVVVTNGSHAGLTRVGGNLYVARVIAASQGEVEITVPADAVRDAVGHPNAEGSLTVTVDMPPSVKITSTSTAPVSIDEDLDLTITFSEPVTGFDIRDVVIQRGNAVNLTGSGAVYTLTIEPAGVERGCLLHDPRCGPYDRVGVKVPAGAARDAGGNRSLPGQFSIATDVEPYRPTIQIRRMEPYRVHALGYDTCSLSPAPGPGPVTGPFFLEFMTSSSAPDFTQGDLTLTNARILDWKYLGEGVHWCAHVEPVTSGQVVVTSPKGAFGSTEYPSVKKAYSIEAFLPPEVTITSAAAAPVHDAFEVAIEFSHPVTDFTSDDLMVTNGEASNLVVATTTIATTSPKVYATGYTATITPAANGVVTVTVAAGAAQDAGGVDNKKAAPFSIEANLDAPTAVISGPKGLVNKAFEIRVTFDKVVSGLQVSDFVVHTETTEVGKTVDPASFYVDNLRDMGGRNVDGDAGREFRVVIGPTPNHLLSLHDSVFVTVSLPAETVQDRAGRKNPKEARYSVEADLKRPQALVTINATSTVTGAFDSDITFTEPVCGIEDDDIYVSEGAAVTQLTPAPDDPESDCFGQHFEVTVTPTRSGNVWVFVPGGAAKDKAGNTNLYGLGQGQAQIAHVQLLRPGTSIEGPEGPVGKGRFDIAIEFSADVTGFDAGDITVGNGTLSDFATSTASRYTAKVTPAADGDVTVDVGEGVATTAATSTTGTNLAAPQFRVHADLTKPKVSIEGPTATQSSAFDIKIVFSEVVTGLTADEVKVGNGAISEFDLTDAEKTPGRTEYTAAITPTADGAVTVDVDAGAAQDVVGNPNEAATQFKVASDETPPTVTVAGGDGVHSVGGQSYTAGPFSVTITFSEPVSGLAADELRVVNGVVTGSLTGTGKAYTAAVTPSATDVWVEVTVPGGVAEDDAGNLNLASPSLRVRSEPPVTVEVDGTDDGPVTGAFEAVIQFSTDVTGFTRSDIVVGNGVASNLQRQSSLATDDWTVTVTPDSSGEVTIDVPARSAKGKYANNDNEAARQFSILAYLGGEIGREVAENTPAATDFGDPVTTSSTGTKTHALGGADAASFDIVAATGQLKTKAALDYETRRAYKVTVTVTQADRVAALIDVIISVTNVNEPPVIDGGDVVKYPENATSSVATYTAADPESDSLAWTLTGTDAAWFDIDDDGVLSFKSPPDFEAPKDVGENNIYALTVNVADVNGGSDSRDIIVTVTNVDIETAELLRAFGLSGKDAIDYPENGTDPVATYTATATESSSPAWTLTATDAARFDIDDDGVLTFKSSPDYEDPKDDGENNVYDLTVNVTATFSGVSASSTLNVAVTVTNVNEPPTAAKDDATTIENTAVDVNVLKNDTDPDANASLTVIAVSEPSNGTADIKDADSGIVTYTPNADFEGPDNFTYTVSDGTLTDDATVVVIVKPVNPIVPPATSAPKVVPTTTTTTKVDDRDDTPDTGDDQDDTPNTGDDQDDTPDTGDDRDDTPDTGDDRDDTPDTGDDRDDTPDTGDDEDDTPDTGDDQDDTPNTGDDEDDTPDTPNTGDDEDDTGDERDDDSDARYVVVPLTKVRDVVVSAPDVNETPTVAGDVIVYYPENNTVPVATYTASDPESDVLTWTLTGTDAAVFGIDADGVLRFEAPPDYESPEDAGADNSYNLRVVASDAEGGDGIAVVIQVTNVDEAGTVTLSPTRPRIGDTLTASLSDPDGAVSGVAWRWAASQDGVDWRPIAGATGESYTPVDGDAGNFLRAEASYTDAEGSEKTARRATYEELSRAETLASTASIGSMGKGPGSAISVLVPNPSLTDPETPAREPAITLDSPKVASDAQEEGTLGGGLWPWLSLAILAAMAILGLLFFVLWRRRRGGSDDNLDPGVG